MNSNNFCFLPAMGLFTGGFTCSRSPVKKDPPVGSQRQLQGGSRDLNPSGGGSGNYWWAPFPSTYNKMLGQHLALLANVGSVFFEKMSRLDLMCVCLCRWGWACGRCARDDRWAASLCHKGTGRVCGSYWLGSPERH